MKLGLGLLIWYLVWFDNTTDLMSYLNKLPNESQVSAKIITAQSARSIGGHGTSPRGSSYGLIFYKAETGKKP